MATRGQIKAQLRAILALPSDDPLGSDAVLDPVVTQAYQGLVAECAEVAPDAFKDAAGVTITAQTGTLPADLYQVRSVKDTDAEGIDFDPLPDDELALVDHPAYSVTGAVSPLTIHTSSGFLSGTLWVSYTVEAEELTDDADVPALLPVSFHDVIALEATFTMGSGGEQRVPDDIRERRRDRKGLLMSHLTRLKPGVVSKTRMVATGEPFP